jgi:quercetin dioxygenase-like cupin family protein
MSKPTTFRRPAEGRWIAQSGDLNRFLAVSADTGGAYSQWESIVPPGGGPRLHVHSREDESFFVIEGEVVFQLGEARSVASAGTYVNLPAGVQHRFHNESASVARLLITVDPAGLEGLFFECGVEVEPGTNTAPPPQPDEPDKIRQTAPRYGVRLIHT